MKRTKNIIITALLFAILAMAIGYSAFATQLTLNGTAEITGVWDVRIISIEAQSVSEGCDPGEPKYTNTTATFNAKLIKPGDSITYVITIENSGTINATLSTVVFKEENDSPAIKYETTELDHSLQAGNQTSFSVKIQYDPKTTENPSIKNKSLTGIIEYIQE